MNFSLLKQGLICLIVLWTITGQAQNSCDENEFNFGTFEPNCQQTSMQGLWWAIPGQLIPPTLIDQYQAEAVLLKVPGYWPKELVDVHKNYPRGIITLWADINLSGHIENGENLAIWPGRQSSAIRIYVDNGRGSWIKTYDNLSIFIEESNSPSDELPAIGVSGLLNSSSSFQLPKLYPGSRVILQLYVDDYRTGSISQPPQLGSNNELSREIMFRQYWHILFLGASLLVAIYAASQAYFSPHRRPIHLFLTMMSLGAGVRLLVTGSILGYLFPSLTVNHHLYLGWISFLGLIAVFLGAQVFMLPMIFNRFPTFKKILLTLSVIPIFMLALIPILKLHEFLLVGHFLRTFYILVSFTYVLFLIWQVYLSPKGQWLPLLATFVILISGSYDAYLYSQNIDPYIESFSVAMFSFIASQALYFGWEHMKLLSREQRLTLNLRELNESLEGQVRNRTHELQAANARLSRVATTDVLTELPNRRAFEADIENEIIKAKSNNQNLCLAIADVDWFKSVNDNYGHDFGDKVLQSLAVYLRKRLRETDFVARIGGEEFAIILPSSDIAAAKTILNELCADVTKIRMNEVPDLKLSISIGYVQWQDNVSKKELYKLADQALYQAKANGRGRVEAS